MPVNRRQFLKTSTLAATSLAVPLVASSRVFGANQEIRVGVVGCGGRGAGEHVPRMQAQPGVRVVALCDPDRKRMDACAAHIQRRYGHKVQQFADVRKLLEAGQVDVVSNATQNYWHGLSTIWACQAGKHVYCEKPLSHYIWEGRQMVHAARQNNRLVETGTQRRSQQSVIKTVEWLQAGNLGKIQYITAFANKPRTSVGKRTTPLEIPDYIDYDLWCGPAKKLPIYRNCLQYDCSFDWNTGDGESCNQGVHEIDMARWCLGESTLPRRVMSIGGRFLFNDAADVPNTQIIYYDFPTAPILYEVHNLRLPNGDVPTFRGVHTGICVQCEGGYANIPDGNVYDNQGKKITSFRGGEDHFQNFIAAVRSGNQKDLHADILEGHISTAITHVGNISYRLGHTASEAEMRAQVKDTPVFEQMFDRFLEHLAGYNIDVETATLGPWLQIDPQNECFRDNEEANKLVHGFYREPYLVTDLSASV
jgi:predicted dehydrogenase